MADRTVKVSLVLAAADYLRGMEQVRKSTEAADTATQKLAKQREAFDAVGKAAVTLGGLAAVGVAAAIKSFADFDAEMSQVKALSHATASEMDRLRNAALTMGQGIGFSATEVADAEIELTKAGVSVSDQLNGALKGALDLAAAGQLNVADATSIAASAMTQFKLSGADVPHIADLLAAGADRALGSVQDLGTGLKYVGPVAASMGISIESTVGTLAELAQNGILADQAGTSLRGVLLSLTSPSTLASKTMREFGINVYDASGKFIGFDGVAGQLQKHLGGLTAATRNQALGQIFGNEQITAATVLMQGGSKAVDEWTKTVDAQGFAAQQAAAKMDNLKGDLTKLGAVFQTDLIQAGSSADNTLRTLTQGVTGLLSAVGSVPQPVMSIGLVLGTVATAVGVVGGSALIAIPKIIAFRDSLKDLQVSGKAAAAGVSGVGLALAGLTLAAGYFAEREGRIAQGAQELQSTLDQTTGAITKTTQATIAYNLAQNGTFATAEKAGISQKQVLDAVLKGGDASDKVANQIRRANDSIGGFISGNSFAADKAGNSIQEMGRSVDRSKTALKNLKDAGVSAADANNGVASSASSASTGLDGVSSSADSATQSVSNLANALKGFGSTQLDANSAARSFQAAIDDAAQSLTTNGKTLDLNTDKGRANAAALDQIASSAIASTAAIAGNGGSQKDATKAMADGRDAYIKAAVALGETTAKANELADGLGLIPSQVPVQFNAYGVDQATAKTNTFKKSVAGVPTSKLTKLQADKTAAQKNVDTLKASLSKVPAGVRTKLMADIADAQKKVAALQAQINAVPSSKSTTFTFNTGAAQAAIQNIAAQINNLNASAPQTAAKIANAAAISSQKRAGGGYITGPGSATSDSIPAWLSNGEYVIKADAVRHVGVAALDALNNRYANGGLVGFASGGSVAAKAAAEQKKRQAEALKLAKAQSKLTSEQFSFLSDVMRGNLTGSSAVDSLYSTASSQTGIGQVAMLNTALQFDRSLTKLTKASDAASSKLDDLRSSSASLASSVSGTVGKADIGVSSAASLNRSLSRQSSQTHEFASLLHTLQQKGVAPALLADIANLGTVQGLPLARSLAQSSTADISSINSNYQAIGNYGNYAGQVVADANYKAQIAAADKNAKSLEAQIVKQSQAIQRIIGHALHVPGYSVGGYTGSASVSDIAGVVHGQEFVVNARATARHRGLLESINSGYPGYATGGFVPPVYMHTGSMNTAQIQAIAAAIVSGMPRGDINPAFHAHPVQNLDPETAMTIMSREISREFAGMVS